MDTKEFLESDLRNSWVSEEKLDVYLRKGYRYIDGIPRKTFTVASIIVEEQHRNSGVLRVWLSRTVGNVGKDFEILYFESVLSTILEGYLKRLQFTQLGLSGEADFYIKVGPTP